MLATLLHSTSRIILVIVCVAVLGILISLSLLTNRDRAVLFQKHKTIVVGNVTRSYLISAPKSGTKPTKLAIGIHAFGDNSRRFAYYTALHNVAGDDTVVVYPNATQPHTKGIKAGWNASFCCGSGWEDGADDVGFIEALIKNLSNQYGITPKNTFLVGFSNGAFMAQRFAAEKPELIGGIAVSSGTIGTKTRSITPRSPVPILLMHGSLDKTVPLLGGATVFEPNFDWHSYADTLSVWQKINGDKVPTKSLVYPEAGHKWYGWRILNIWQQRPEASVESINFLKGL